jgi:hypothetical protein
MSETAMRPNESGGVGAQHYAWPTYHATNRITHNNPENICLFNKARQQIKVLEQLRVSFIHQVHHALIIPHEISHIRKLGVNGIMQPTLYTRESSIGELVDLRAFPRLVCDQRDGTVG